MWISTLGETGLQFGLLIFSPFQSFNLIQQLLPAVSTSQPFRAAENKRLVDRLNTGCFCSALQASEPTSCGLHGADLSLCSYILNKQYVLGFSTFNSTVIHQFFADGLVLLHQIFIGLSHHTAHTVQSKPKWKCVDQRI